MHTSLTAAMGGWDMMSGGDEGERDRERRKGVERREGRGGAGERRWLKAHRSKSWPKKEAATAQQGEARRARGRATLQGSKLARF